jgi:NADH:ubiquinone oxidoreductase subunit E
MDDQIIESIVAEHNGSSGGMLSILSEIQSKYGYLSQSALRQVAATTGESLTDIYAVVTFYKAFTLKPRGRHHVSVCLGTACHVRGAPKIAEEFSRQLAIQPGETTPDKEFSLETVNCLGACALGPTVVADGRYFRHVTTAKIQRIIEQARAGFKDSGQGADDRIFPVVASCPLCGRTLMDAGSGGDGHPFIKIAVSRAGKENVVRLSALYGSPKAECDGDIPDGALTALSCPHCSREFPRLSDCPECGAKMAMMAVGERAALHVCARRGCPGHRLDIGTDIRESSEEGQSK